MNVEAFIGEFRRVMEDTATPYLWSDEEVTTYLNDAVNEACERALLIEDRVTPAVCSVALVANQADYRPHDSVIQIKRLAFRGRALSETSVEQMDNDDAQWEGRTGEPRQFIYGEATGLRLVPAPRSAGTVSLTVYRLPLVALSVDNDSGIPEIPARHHMRLLPWVYRCAYLKQDSETLNESQAAKHEAVFVASFGERPDANVQRKQRDRRPQVVQFNW